MPVPASWLRPLLCVALAASLLSCGSEEPAPPVGFATAWLTPTGTIPEDVERLRVVRVLSPTTQIDLFERSVDSLEDLDGNGRRELVVQGLDVGQAVDLELQGIGADGLPLYVGRSGPVFLTHGERRYIDIAMYPIGQTTIDRFETPPPRMLLQATTLLDGRVLVSGGFDRVGPATCPSGLPGEPTCFQLEASGDAWLYDPATARFHEVQGGMLAPRGGHTATLLEDGRVLIAGGAPRAVLAFSRVGGFADAREIFFFPESTHASFELFEPALNMEEEDIERDGDPGAGGFVGGDGGPAPGPLNHARFLHAAALLPHDGGQVMLAGGIDNPSNYEIFDARKPGGAGVYAGGGALGASRIWPSAVGLGGSEDPRVWIFGGGPATSNAELADVWTPDPDGANPNGSVVPANTPPSAFPNPNAARASDAHPEYALVRPVVAALGDGAYALVTGWYGPRCPLNMFTVPPIFETSMTSICAVGRGPGNPDRSFTVANADGGTNRTQPPSGTRHAFGEAVTLADGRVLVVGGVEDEIFTPIAQTVVYTGVMSGMARGTGGARLVDGRLFHGAARILDTGVLVVGGAVFDSAGTSMRLVDRTEALMLAPPARESVRPTVPESGE